MKAGDVHRGRGPWPKSNDAVAVRQWLTDRIAVFESRERQAIIRQLLDNVSGVSRADRLIGNWVASESQLERLALACDRLNDGEPLQYILGTAHFMGLDVCVNKSVLIPRPETEELVHRMLQYISSSKSQKRKVVDIGAGSGAISLAWKAKRPMDEVHGLDVSPEALHTASANAERLGLAIDWHKHDILASVGAKDAVLSACDVVLSNPPYIPESEKSGMSRSVTDWEPNMALFVSDRDPLVFYKRIILGCATEGWLSSEGWLALECHRDAVEAVRELFHQVHWKTVEKERDMQENWRMIFAQRAAIASKS